MCNFHATHKSVVKYFLNEGKCIINSSFRNKKKQLLRLEEKKRKEWLGITLSQDVEYELNDCTYNFLIDNIFSKNDFIGPNKCCFVRGNISKAVSVLLSCKPDSISQSSWGRFWKTEASQTYSTQNPQKEHPGQRSNSSQLAVLTKPTPQHGVR